MYAVGQRLALAQLSLDINGAKKTLGGEKGTNERLERLTQVIEASSKSTTQQSSVMIVWTRRIFASYVVLAVLTALAVVAGFIQAFRN